jgi:hypothetical protein
MEQLVPQEIQEQLEQKVMLVLPEQLVWMDQQVL